MKNFVIFIAVIAVVSAKEGNVEKRGVSSGYAAVAAAPVIAKAAPVAYAAPQYAAYAAPAFAAYAAPAYAPQAYAAPAFAAYSQHQPIYQQYQFAAPQPQFAGYNYAPAAYAAPAYAAPAYAAPAYAGHGYAAPAYAAAPVAAVAPVLKSGAPQQYSQQIPAAAIRNVETVGVTKTITPVVTKTTTYNTHSEPALSVGHVQGYSQQAHGPAKLAPVQYTTAYTQYINPTVGSNGPVTYSGPAVSQGVAIQQGAVAVGGAQPVAAYAGPGFAGPGFAGQAIGLGGFGYSGLGLGIAGYSGAQLGYAAGPAVAYAQPAVAYAQPQYLAAAAPVAVQAQYAAAPVSSNYGAPAKGGY